MPVESTVGRKDLSRKRLGITTLEDGKGVAEHRTCPPESVVPDGQRRVLRTTGHLPHPPVAAWFPLWL